MSHFGPGTCSQPVAEAPPALPWSCSNVGLALTPRLCWTAVHALVTGPERALAQDSTTQPQAALPLRKQPL